MRFWELFSVFRGKRVLLEQLLYEPRWRKYYDRLSVFDRHGSAANRAVMDESLPNDLVMAAMELLTVVFYVENGFLRMVREGPSSCANTSCAARRSRYHDGCLSASMLNISTALATASMGNLLSRARDQTAA